VPILSLETNKVGIQYLDCDFFIAIVGLDNVCCAWVVFFFPCLIIVEKGLIEF
jgi:hypothetical protein